MGGRDAFDAFMKKFNENKEGRKFKPKNEIVITIQLQGGNKSRKLDEEFMRVIQNEYATRYLEILGLSATQANIDKLLMKNPLSSCEISCGWNTSGWLADTIQIYPNRPKKKSFDNQRDHLRE